MASKHYFDFLSSVLELIPDEDKGIFAELWHGYEQLLANNYQKWVEVELNTSLASLQTYSTERWLPYDFNSSNEVFRPVVFTSNQDISGGVNLSQRYLVKFSVANQAPIEVDLRGLNPVNTTLQEIVSRINNAIGFPFARGVFEDSIIQLVTRQLTPVAEIVFYPASVPSRDAAEFVFGLLPEDLPLKVPEFPHVYRNPYSDSRVVSVPRMQNGVSDEKVTEVLEENIDYLLERSTGTFAFKEAPEATYWAKKTLLDLETPWNNYGWLMEIYDTNSPQYLNVVQGLWFAFWTGPRPSNIRSALYLLFGLPVSPDDGVVFSVSPTTIQIKSSSTDALSTFDIPDGLNSIVSVGDVVTRFQPLVNGIDVFDKVNSPGFIEREVGRAGVQPFLLNNASRGSGPDTDETRALQLLEEHTFLPQISVESFISPNINLSNVRRFLTDIKPLEKTFLFQVIVGKFVDIFKITEKIGLDVALDVTPNLDSNQTTFAQASTLLTYETSFIGGMQLDSDIIGIRDEVNVEVNDKFGPVETFDV